MLVEEKKHSMYKDSVLFVVSGIHWGSWSMSAVDTTTILGIKLLWDSIQVFFVYVSKVLICSFSYEWGSENLCIK